MKPAPSGITSEQARERLDELMHQGERWALQIGQLLTVIHERQFYREWGFTSLRSFLETTYNISPGYGYRLIDYANVLESLPEKVSPIGDTSIQLITTDVVLEEHARVLKNVPEEDRPRVVAEALDTGLSAQSIRESAERVAKEKQVNEPPGLRDATGWLVPHSGLRMFQRREHVKDLLDKLSTLRGTIRRVIEADNDPLFGECDLQSMMTFCDNLHAQLKLAIPFAVCPYCHGVEHDVCTACKGRGVMSQFRWEHTVPEEFKAMRKQALEDEKRK